MSSKFVCFYRHRGPEDILEAFQAREGFRQAYVLRKLTLRRDNLGTLSKQCPLKCAEFLRSNFSAPELKNGTSESAILQDSGMAEFSANFVSLPLEEMFSVQDENCNQWEAKWQCLHGCFQVVQGVPKSSDTLKCPSPFATSPGSAP